MISTGEQIGRYRIRSAIGKGGMGEVFLAEDTELERLVALKVLPVEVARACYELLILKMRFYGHITMLRQITLSMVTAK